METIKIKPQTVILFVGPENCGKSYFAEHKLLPRLNDAVLNKPVNIQYLSSDLIREELLGHNIESDDIRKDHVSEQAFNMLRTKLTSVVTYPVNADYVVVDTTGMSDKFRKEVMEITYAANYNLQLMIFDYKNRNDYYEFAKDDFLTKKRISDSVKRFKEKMFELTKKEYPNQVKIKSNNFNDLSIELEGLYDYEDYFLDPTLDYLIIGDVHGCYNELKELLLENEFVFDFENNNDIVRSGLSKDGNPLKIILIGDIIDKGDQIAETIRFVHYLVDEGFAVMVKGNHENFVYNYLKGVKPYTELAPEFISTFLNTVEILNNDEELKNMFFELFEKSKDFYTTNRFIVTHAPCEIKHLGKTRITSLKAQRNIRFARRNEFKTDDEYVASTEKVLGFMKEESRYNNPYHVVGHVMVPNVVQFNNKIMLDTGCVAGGRLSSFEITAKGSTRFKSVKSRREETGEIFQLFDKKKFDLTELDPKDQTRIKFLCLEKVNFISGTMAPADKNQVTNELESLPQAIEYYRQAGVKKVILQPKFMGSRGNVYLFKDVEKSYVVTRNGYLVKPEVLEQLRPAIASLHEKIYKDYDDVKLIILDAEILPWSLIGKGLINRHFEPVAIAARSENDILFQHGFENVLNDYKNSSDYIQYVEDRKTLKKDDLVSKYGNAKEKTLRTLYDYKHLPLSEESNGIGVFENQLKIHGVAPETPDIQPFAILKIVYDDDTEFLFDGESNIDMYRRISTQPFAVLDFEDNDRLRRNYPEKYSEQEYIVSVHSNGAVLDSQSLSKFYNYLTKIENMEGIVMKPETVYVPGIAPYIKVRNEDYLTIVYGHNYKFEHKYNKLIAKKGVKRKLQASIKEYELGMKMLKTPYNKITTDNQEYKQLLAQMIVEVEKEKNLDPRL